MTATITRRWTYSAALAYVTCPHQWWLTRVANTPRAPAEPEAFRGMLMHAGLAAGWPEAHRLIQAGVDPAMVELSADDALIDAMEQEATRLNVPVTPEMVDTACRALHYCGPQPGDELIGTELDLDIRVDGVPVGYRADLIYRRDGAHVVRDWKSRTTLPKTRDLPRDWQLGVGALAVARTYGTTNVLVEMASINGATSVCTPIGRDQARRHGQLVAEVAHKAEADTEHAPKPGKACGACPVRGACFVHNPVPAIQEAIS
jgi:CRISPR/Cas system-associated exonuclease Cas4 (RecB family)